MMLEDKVKCNVAKLRASVQQIFILCLLVISRRCRFVVSNTIPMETSSNDKNFVQVKSDAYRTERNSFSLRNCGHLHLAHFFQLPGLEHTPGELNIISPMKHFRTHTEVHAYMFIF